MNREEFYKEIGNIDDDLITEAGDVRSAKKNRAAIYSAVGAAACFCLICAGLLFGSQRDKIYINEISAPSVSKVVVPADENTEIVTITYKELLDYYGIGQLPNALGDGLTREEQSYFAIYRNDSGNVLYDANIFYFSNADRSINVSVAIAKGENLSDSFSDNAVWSEINEVSVMIAKSNDRTYWASLGLNELSVKIISYGMNGNEFIDIIKELLAYY